MGVVIRLISVGVFSAVDVIGANGVAVWESTITTFYPVSAIVALVSFSKARETKVVVSGYFKAFVSVQ